MPDRRARISPRSGRARSRARRNRSILVRAPAGSGKTDLLTRRFLRLLGEVDDPGRDRRHHIYQGRRGRDAQPHSRGAWKRRQSGSADASHADELPHQFSMGALADRALARSEALGWNLLDLPAQLRIRYDRCFLPRPCPATTAALAPGRRPRHQRATHGTLSPRCTAHA